MFVHRPPTRRERLRAAFGDLLGAWERVKFYPAPCGHNAQGDSRSWWCTVCGARGGSSG